MLERYASYYLNLYLGKYVRGLDKVRGSQAWGKRCPCAMEEYEGIACTRIRFIMKIKGDANVGVPDRWSVPRPDGVATPPAGQAQAGPIQRKRGAHGPAAES